MLGSNQRPPGATDRCCQDPAQQLGATIGRRAARCRGSRRLRRGVDQRRAVRSSARSLLSRPSVGRRLLRRTTCGLTATRTRVCRPGRIPAGPRYQPSRAYPRSQPPRAPHETEKRRGLRFERRGERRRWATGEPTPGTPTRPKDRNSSPKDQRSRWQVAAPEPATAQPHRAMRWDRLRSPADPGEWGRE